MNSYRKLQFFHEISNYEHAQIGLGGSNNQWRGWLGSAINDIKWRHQLKGNGVTTSGRSRDVRLRLSCGGCGCGCGGAPQPQLFCRRNRNRFWRQTGRVNPISRNVVARGCERWTVWTVCTLLATRFPSNDVSRNTSRKNKSVHSWITSRETRLVKTKMSILGSRLAKTAVG